METLNTVFGLAAVLFFDVLFTVGIMLLWHKATLPQLVLSLWFRLTKSERAAREVWTMSPTSVSTLLFIKLPSFFNGALVCKYCMAGHLGLLAAIPLSLLFDVSLLLLPFFWIAVIPPSVLLFFMIDYLHGVANDRELDQVHRTFTADEIEEANETPGVYHV